MKDQHTVRFGDAISGLMDGEAADGLVVSGTQNGALLDAEIAGIPSSNDDHKRQISPTIRQLRNASMKSDRKELRKRAMIRMLDAIFTVETVDRIAGVMDFLLNAVFIIGLVMVGYHTVLYIAAGNPVMTVCCGIVLWILLKASDAFGKQSE